MLDQEVDLVDYVDEWGRRDANKAGAYHYLYGFDLFIKIQKMA